MYLHETKLSNTVPLVFNDFTDLTDLQSIPSNFYYVGIFTSDNPNEIDFKNYINNKIINNEKTKNIYVAHFSQIIVNVWKEINTLEGNETNLINIYYKKSFNQQTKSNFSDKKNYGQGYIYVIKFQTNIKSITQLKKRPKKKIKIRK